MMKLVSICLFLHFIGCGLALRCSSPDGLLVEDVRKVVKKCMKKVGQDNDSDSKSFDEYENFDRNYENTRRGNDDNTRRGNNENSRRVNDRDSFGPRQGQETYDNQRSNDRSTNQFQSNKENDRNRNNNSDSRSRQNNSRDANQMHEKDKACVLQCFFFEMKMTNEEGFPDKHKTLQVLTQDLRDHELRDFYADSIQECFHMIETNDPKLRRDNCLFSKSLLSCLAERARMNCADWDGNAMIFK